MSPAKTAPRLTPMRIETGTFASTIARSASSMRSSSSPVLPGAPAVRISLPPSTSTSDDKSAMPCSSVAASTVPTSRCSASAAASGPARSISASVPSMRMKAIVTGRCSEPPPPPLMCVRIAGDRQCASVVGGDVRPRYQRQLFRGARRLARQQHARALGLAQAARRQRRGRLRTHQDLAGTRLVLHGHHAAPGGAHRQQFDVRRSDGEEVECSRMHALRHPQRHPGAGNVDPADVAQHAAHADRGAAGARRMVGILEPQQQRVAAELEQAGAVVVGDRQDRLEAAADHLGDLLGAFPALPGKPLGQLGEARDVDEGDRAVDRPPALVRMVDQVLLQDPRQVQAEAFGGGFGFGHAGFLRNLCCKTRKCTQAPENRHVLAVGTLGARPVQCAMSAAAPYATLTPDRILDALAGVGMSGDGRLLALNSYENRVYQVGLEEAAPSWPSSTVRGAGPMRHPRRARLRRRTGRARNPGGAAAGRRRRNAAPSGRLRFAVYPRHGGRTPELDDPDTLEWMGRFIGRIHAIGALTPFP